MSASERGAAPHLPDRGWLTSKEIANFLGLTVETLHDWRKRRTGPPYHRMVGRLYYRKEEFLEWFSASRWG